MQTQSKVHQTMQNQPYHCCERRARPHPIGIGRNERAERPTPGMSTPLSKKDAAQFALCVPNTVTLKMHKVPKPRKLTQNMYPLSSKKALNAEITRDVLPENPHFQALQSNIQHRTSGCQVRGAAKAPYTEASINTVERSIPGKRKNPEVISQ